jgi:hypothetical protein
VKDTILDECFNQVLSEDENYKPPSDEEDEDMSCIKEDTPLANIYEDEDMMEMQFDAGTFTVAHQHSANQVIRADIVPSAMGVPPLTSPNNN